MHRYQQPRVGPEVGGASPRRRPRTSAAELASASAVSDRNTSRPFTGRGLRDSSGNGDRSGGGGGYGGGASSGAALQLARKDAEITKLTHDIKRLIEQQMPMQQVVRDLVEQCKRLQEENSFLVLDREDYTTKLQQSEDAEEDSHQQMEHVSLRNERK